MRNNVKSAMFCGKETLFLHAGWCLQELWVRGVTMDRADGDPRLRVAMGGRLWGKMFQTFLKFEPC
jgi:hypothetical protein